MNLELKDQLFIVADATSGFGKAVANKLLNEGASIIVVIGNLNATTMQLNSNVTFLNKVKLRKTLDEVAEYSVLTIDGSECNFIDYDILEVINEYESKAHDRNIELHLKGYRYQTTYHCRYAWFSVGDSCSKCIGTRLQWRHMCCRETGEK